MNNRLNKYFNQLNNIIIKNNPNVKYLGKHFNYETKQFEHYYSVIKKGEIGYISWEGDK